jgi:hypothetical protein
MKTSRIPLIVFVLCCLGYLGFLTWTAPLLPERLASHFGASGQADGWMPHSFYKAPSQNFPSSPEDG